MGTGTSASAFGKLLGLGVERGMTPEERKYVRYTNAASSLAFLASLFFFCLELPIIADFDDLGRREVVLIGARFAASLLFLVPVILNVRRMQRAGRAVFGLCAVGFTLGLTFLYGADAPSHLFFIAIVAGFVPLFPQRERPTRAVILILTLAAFLFSMYFRHSHEPLVTIQRIEVRTLVDFWVSLGAMTLVLTFALAQRRANDDAEHAVVTQREKADGLLLNILPEAIAKRLKEHPGAIADGFDDVTVMFADLVGFTPLSATMSPQDLVGLMDRIFSEFDHIAERLGLEKIKTIGDAYMVAGGIPLARPDHADAIADMALDLLRVVDQLETPTGAPLQIRVGIASGPAVAGVIGKKKFAYDLWGDTVNTASRMESHSEAGRIHVNEEAYGRLRDRYEFIDRGMVTVKGKGELSTWYLVGKRAGA